MPVPLDYSPRPTRRQLRPRILIALVVAIILSLSTPFCAVYFDHSSFTTSICTDCGETYTDSTSCYIFHSSSTRPTPMSLMLDRLHVPLPSHHYLFLNCSARSYFSIACGFSRTARPIEDNCNSPRIVNTLEALYLYAPPGIADAWRIRLLSPATASDAAATLTRETDITPFYDDVPTPAEFNSWYPAHRTILQSPFPPTPQAPP